jgi:NAD(P)-dependent dehydrogenase (short-subunit alcohol dehydrogenase family)
VTNKNILIIGGNSGIGAGIVKQLAGSAHLYLASRSAKANTQNPSVTSFSLDVTKDISLPEQLPDYLDGLVYCPGTIRLRPFTQIKDEEYLLDLVINFIGAVRVIRAALPRLKKAEKAASIVLFSTVAVQTGMAYHTSIASAKGAIEGLTRSLAAELAPKIRVNAIAPSLTDTPLGANLLANEQKRQAAADRHPLKRFGHPADLANAAIFLLDDQSAWMTGQIIAVDGGMSSIRIF